MLTIIVVTQAEHSAQIIKNIMRKCKYSNTNWKHGLLEYLCTPLSEKLASPTELLAGRQFKGLQPSLHAKLTPNTSFSEQVKEQLVAKKEMEKSQHVCTSLHMTYRSLPLGLQSCIMTTGLSLGLWAE